MLLTSTIQHLPPRWPSSMPPFSPRSTPWLLWELHSGLHPGWGPSLRGRSDALLRAPDPSPCAAGSGRGDVGHCPHAAAAASERAQELLQRRHPAWLHWHRDTHLICTVQRLNNQFCPMAVRAWVCVCQCVSVYTRKNVNTCCPSPPPSSPSINVFISFCLLKGIRPTSIF